MKNTNKKALSLSYLCILANASNSLALGETRELLSITPEKAECLYKTRDLYSMSGLANYDLLEGRKKAWRMPMTQPFCNTDSDSSEPTQCDTKRLPSTVVDHEAVKNICENESGDYYEIDVKINERSSKNDWEYQTLQVIRNIPVCVNGVICRDVGIEKPAEFITMNSLWDDFGGDPRSFKFTPSLSSCDERADDKFFVKYSNKSARTAVTMSCKQLANGLPTWMINNPCDATESPSGEPAVASIVCPITCKTGRCTENKSSLFLKNASSGATRSCNWLGKRSDKKKKKLCSKKSRKFYRQEGFPAIPSAYSACPQTCSQFVEAVQP